MTFNRERWTCVKIQIVIYIFVLLYVFIKLILGEESDNYDFWCCPGSTEC